MRSHLVSNQIYLRTMISLDIIYIRYDFVRDIRLGTNILCGITAIAR